jgi:hypothetical protein
VTKPVISAIRAQQRLAMAAGTQAVVANGQQFGDLP